MLAVVASFSDSTQIMNVLESPQSLSDIGSLEFAYFEKSRFFHGSSLVHTAVIQLGRFWWH